MTLQTQSILGIGIGISLTAAADTVRAFPVPRIFGQHNMHQQNERPVASRAGTPGEIAARVPGGAQ
jgi:hypothetical protein